MKKESVKRNRGFCGRAGCRHWEHEHREGLFGAECVGKNPHPDDTAIKCQCAGFVWKATSSQPGDEKHGQV